MGALPHRRLRDLAMNLCTALIVLVLFIATNNAFTPALPPAFPYPRKSAPKKDGYGAVTCGQEICSRVGRDILRAGGNAADAAVAAQFCLGVVSLDLTGLGGGGFVLIRHSNGSKRFVDFRETSPAWSVDFSRNGTLLYPNSTITRKRYANLLEDISEGGPDVVNKGRIANATANAVKAAGGIMTLDDLRNYKVGVRPTLEIQYHGYRLTSTSAPTSGPVTLGTLRVVEG